MSHVLEIDSVELSFGTRKILSGIYLRCDTGHITGLLGRNGAGKSCLMNVLYGVLPAEKSVRVDGVSVRDSFKHPDLVMYLPQFNFIPGALSLRRIFKDFALDYDAFVERFPEYTGKTRVSIGDLSGGERRLVELYVVVCANAQFAMLDEPFTHLHPLQIEKVKELLMFVSLRKGLLVTDHMYDHILDISDSLYVLTNGRTVLTKTVDNIEALGYARINP